jgi:hypothetical protein
MNESAPATEPLEAKPLKHHLRKAFESPRVSWRPVGLS